ncbi:MAG: DNA-directed RNA polymerase subunit A' [Candidatus Parvarchaeota archaeon]|nr:DNA-directed RNA polymerase subunit A' [Candidatus Jingweiarchaeum tengchongense]MCW1298198.1 DNA-directed RNA polymerase subunit A' [Candidatus Jingweiarchaeum tengchongense]MCW1299996.1 DNA-directed RNA polymerase subunit A' [Candidatus Jingweiarchaeum tengchongense]MCW1305014.1 DNA-directed RNA polymerase subunit A' [Candidatus Jingweiarchaeum tengchongense]MCW1305455.1 DNA-directed RNA polymerase subunit A' [Candidatus Jingweiarchaeum tengchongense]
MAQVIKEKIDAIEFRILSPAIIRKMGVVKIITPDLYDADGYPIEGGLMDLRMGVVDPGLRCRTCGGRVKECPGHFGYIELARPVIHIKYIPWIYDFLRCTCSDCGKILLEEKEIEKWKKRLDKIKKTKGELAKWNVIKLISQKAKNAKVCPHCDAKKKKIRYEKPLTFIEGETKLTPIDIRERLEKIPDEHSELLGLDPQAGRPEWMVLTLLPVPPVTVRPSITLESGQRSEDDLTHKLGDIIRTNQRLFENLNAGAPEIIIEDLWDLLQYHITTFFTNNVSQIPPARHRSGRPLKTLAQRIRSKEGRFRRNLAGKRVNFSARTVISPDARIKIDEVGIPIDIAKELTIPERVNEWNIDWLKEFIKRGPNEHPGANYVITPEGKRKRITDETKKQIIDELTYGYIVERHLMDNDIVIFNRQPSLHKMSMMAHRAKILPYRTFRINLCTTVPYGADFDGDEMNLHVPQTEEARAEAEILMEVQNQIVTPRYGLPLIGCKQDHITGCFLLTKKDTVLSREDVFTLLSQVGIEKEIEKDSLSGKEIFSLLLPDDFNYVGKTRTCLKCAKCKEEKCPHDNYVKVVNGKLISGVIDSNSIGAEDGEMLQKIIQEYGNSFASDFIYKCSLLGISYLKIIGFSILPTDTDLPPRAFEKIKFILNKSEEKVRELIKKYEAKKLQAYPGRTVEETLEFKIIEILNKGRNITGKIVERHASKDNSTIIMATSGAKGSLLNLALISACVGQQALRGSRINKGYTRRTLPHFKKNDITPRCRGFVRHGYKGGLDPFEFFFHAITGRDSVMDTSMRTPKSGYMQRRLINALQDLKICYDGTVRDAYDKIIQFQFGEDGIDVTKTDYGQINVDSILNDVLSREIKK